MPLHKHIRDDVGKYEDVIRTEFKNATFFIYYEVDGEEKFKRLPYRATILQLQTAIESIRKEINYYQRRKEKIESGFYKLKDRPPAFVTSGEKDGKGHETSIFSSS